MKDRNVSLGVAKARSGRTGWIRSSGHARIIRFPAGAGLNRVAIGATIDDAGSRFAFRILAVATTFDARPGRRCSAAGSIAIGCSAAKPRSLAD